MELKKMEVYLLKSAWDSYSDAGVVCGYASKVEAERGKREYLANPENDGYIAFITTTYIYL